MIKKEKTLYLGSTSRSRQMLLNEAEIPFTLVDQSADETQCDWGLSLHQVVENIALHKMDHVLLPQAQEGDICFVLTADTLTENKFGEIEGKPIDRVDAIKKLKSARNGVRTGTSFCLDRRIYKDNAWLIDVRIGRFVDATYCFNVPDDWIDFYLDNIPLVGSCAIAIEGFGGQFLKDINGSYTAVVGLPMYELREALIKLDFFN